MPETESTLRDCLAVQRTRLANERTLLAYARTALMLVASGATLWRVQPLGSADRPLGMALVAAGAVVMTIGVVRFLQARRDLADDGV